MAKVVPLNVLIEGKRKPALSWPLEGCLSAFLSSLTHGRDLPPRGQISSAAWDGINEKLLISRPVSVHPAAPGSPPPVPRNSRCLSSRWLRPIAEIFPSLLLIECMQLFLFYLITGRRRPGSKDGLSNAFAVSFLEGVFDTGLGGCPRQVVDVGLHLKQRLRGKASTENG